MTDDTTARAEADRLRAEASRALQETFLERLNQFLSAAHNVEAEWDDIGNQGYPADLPSFDEFACDLVKWRDAVRAALEAKGSES